MARSDTFKKQHQTLLETVGQIANSLNPAALQKDASAVYNLLSGLTGKIKIHLTMEDDSLYPEMKNAKDQATKDVAAKFSSEMGGLKNAYLAYVGKWSSAAKIQADPQTFINDTKGIAAALGQRIQKEEKELYPMLDKIA